MPTDTTPPAIDFPRLIAEIPDLQAAYDASVTDATAAKAAADALAKAQTDATDAIQKLQDAQEKALNDLHDAQEKAVTAAQQTYDAASLKAAGSAAVLGNEMAYVAELAQGQPGTDPTTHEEPAPFQPAAPTAPTAVA